MQYEEFLKNKIIIAEDYGFDVEHGSLNASQVNGKKEKHICPLQFDIITRLINRYTVPGDIVDDPFGGLFSTAYKAIEMGRRAISTELNTEYFKDGVFYVNSMHHKIHMPTLFDTLKEAI